METGIQLLLGRPCMAGNAACKPRAVKAYMPVVGEGKQTEEQKNEDEKS